MTHPRGNASGDANQGAAVDTSNRVPVPQAPSPLRATMSAASAGDANISAVDTSDRIPVPQAASPLRATMTAASAGDANQGAPVDTSNRIPVPQAPRTTTS